MPEKNDLKKVDFTQQKPIILYQGALNVGRGLGEVLEAMAEIQEAELWLAGEGDLSDFLREKTIQLQKIKVKVTTHETYWNYTSGTNRFSSLGWLRLR